ncbi:MAG: flagellar filament capping protein FliD [Phycisphaerales bacterium]|nr:flagellar filament capping protein FliD [Phycisphaerales bacterium]
MSGTISSGVGLLSGLPVQSIIAQLLQIEGRPLRLLQQRADGIQTQRTAFAEISARLLGLKNTVTRLDEVSFFRKSRATSSDPDVLTATATEGAARGAFRFQVQSLVTNHQVISRGFESGTRSIGVGTITVETGDGRLDRATSLDRLNGGDGVRRGKIEITDSAGKQAVIDLTTVTNVQDVIDEINGTATIRVRIETQGDHLVLVDEAGGTGSLAVRDVGAGSTAKDLGIAGAATGDSIVGGRIHYLADGTSLTTLNDGNGVAIGKVNKDITIQAASDVPQIGTAQPLTVGLRGLLSAGATGQAHTGTHFDQLNAGRGIRQGTFKITNRAGQSAEIVVDDEVQTIGDLIQKINAAGLGVTASVGAAEGQLSLRDDSTRAGAAPVFKIEDVTGFAAADLGITGETTGQTLSGGVILSIDTLGDVLRAINFAEFSGTDGQLQRNDVYQARIGQSGRGIEIVSTTGQAFSVTASPDGVDSDAATNLGIVGSSDANGLLAGRSVLAGLNSVLLSSLRGGKGVETGVVRLTAADGRQTELDLSSASTVQDVVDLVNAQSEQSGIRAELNSSGLGVVFHDESAGTGTTRLEDVSGGVVRDLFGASTGVVDDFTDGERATANLQLQYVSRTTKLADLNGGRGISEGTFKVTARNGHAVNIEVNKNQTTVDDLLTRINSLLPTGVTARINETGDGIEFIDRTVGDKKLTITDQTGATTARSLNLTGTAVNFVDEDGATGQRIDGSYEIRVNVDGQDTLNGVRDEINRLSNGRVRAVVINDGSGARPFHLILNSEVTGTRGRLVLDGGTTGLSFDTLVQAKDAVVFFGGSDAQRPVVLTSSTNSLTNVLDGVTLDLVGTSPDPVDLSVTQDIDSIVNDLESFVSSYNAVLDSMAQATRFDAEAGVRGVLVGDSTVLQIQNRLRTTLTARVVGADPGFDRLSSVGFHSGTGGRLSFNADEFRAAFSADPEKVERLFTTEEGGFGDKIDKLLSDLTDNFDGVLSRKDHLLDDRKSAFDDRIVALQEALDRKQSRLERQFQGLESALGNLQGAQSSLGVLASLAARR